jgi:hypothetical protein
MSKRKSDVAELIAAGPAELRMYTAANMKMSEDAVERDPDAAALIGHVLAAMMTQATAGARFTCLFCERPFMRKPDIGEAPEAAAIAVLSTPIDFRRDNKTAIVAAPICTACNVSSAEPLRDRVLAHYRDAHPELTLLHATDIATPNSRKH